MPSLDSGLSLNTAFTFEELPDRVVKLVHHPFFQRDDRIVRDCNVFRADLRAAFGDVAQADPLSFLQLCQSVFRVKRMHFQRGGINKVSRTDEFVVEMMFPQDVTDILAEETLDALA